MFYESRYFWKSTYESYRSVSETMSYLVAALKLSVVCASTLDRIVCQMNKTVLKVLNIVLFTCSPEVAVRVEVALKVPIHSRSKTVAPNVELSLLVKKRLLAILLNYV